ncbi:hypothetical protein HDU67_000008 [Dinochytrium kinnereticum]|nr:hypothetical protein HDU67_000008 [Dinochytrium kinnereticum]
MQTVELNKDKAADSMKRYAYLLGQTDLFAHFINMAKLKGANLSAFNAATETQETETKTTKSRAKEGYIVEFTGASVVKGGTMRDYQMQGLNWLISLYHNGINGILADEMGLGKTLQSISFLGFLKHVRGINGKHIIIVPKSTLHNWMTEITRWVPDLNPFLFHGDKEARAKLVKEKILTEDFEICVTSYEMCLLEKSALRKISWQCLIIDEAHRIKNENSSLSQIVREFNCRNRLLLTGTPLQNNLHELWALLNFLLPDVFSSAEDFNSWFEERGGDQDQVVAQLHRVLRPFLLRRIKADVEKSLLPKKRTNLYVGMSAMQRKWYQKILEKDIDAVNGSLGGKKTGGKTRLLNIVMQLRKCCNHPYLFDGAEPGPPYTTDQHIIDNAGKMAILDRLLARLKANGSRVLLFSQMSRMLDILEDYCVFRGFDYCRIDGNTAHEDRIQSIDEFNKPGSSKFIFLLTTRAGGLGINLATADIVVMYDSDWNPQVDLQAEDRAHRIGQTKQVIVFRFITENAIEEKVIDRATQKLRLDHTISNEDIEDVLRRGEEKTAELDKKYNSMGLDDVKNFMSDGSVYQWEGSDFRSQVRFDKFGSYAVDDYFREALRVGNKSAGPKAPRAPKSSIILNDFQFFPPDLSDLLEKELLAQKKAQGVKAVKRTSTSPEEDDEFLEKERIEEQAKIDNAESWTDADNAEKEALLQQGFESWTRKDFLAFIKANVEHGRDNIVEIAKEVEGKTPEEVNRYSAVFWRRYKEIQDWEKHISNIEKGERTLQKQLEIQESLTRKIASTRLPLQQLRFTYGQSRGKNFTEEEDRFIVVCLEKFGFGTEDVYEKIREEIKHSTLFRFDWFIKSRTAVEIQRRCQTLISLIQKEEAEETEREERKRKAAPVTTPKSEKGMKKKRNCDVDPTVLADYVVALLKHDKSIEDLKETCISQLDDFLREETVPFVENLFDYMATEDSFSTLLQETTLSIVSAPQEYPTAAGDGDQITSSIPGKDQDSPFTEAGNGNDLSSGRFSNNPGGDIPNGRQSSRRASETGGRFSSPGGIQSDDVRFSKKRRSYDSGDEVSDRRGKFPRSETGNGSDYNHSSKRWGQFSNFRDSKSGDRGWGSGSGGSSLSNSGAWDNSISQWMVHMDASGIEAQGPKGSMNQRFRGDRSGSHRGSQMPSRGSGRRPRCRDYNEHGYCLRGDQCQYEHVADRSVGDIGIIPSSEFGLDRRAYSHSGNVPFKSFSNAPEAAESFAAAPAAYFDAYDPEAMSFGTIDVGLGSTAPITQAPGFAQNGLQWRPYGQQRGSFGGRGRGSMSRGRVKSYGYQPYPARPKGNTIVVDNIPEESNTLENVNEYFKKFGTIVNIQIQPRKAIIQFSSPEEATRAHQSPEAIFSNRFVKVYFDTGPTPDSTQIDQKQRAEANAIGNKGPTGPGLGVSVIAPVSAVIPSKAAADDGKKSVRAMLELQKQEEQLIQKQIEFKKQILEKLERKDITSKERAVLLEAWKTVETSARTTLTSATTASATVKALVPGSLSHEEREKARLDRELDLISQQNDSALTKEDITIEKQTVSSTDSEAALLAHLESLKAEALRVGVDPSVALKQEPASTRGRWATWKQPRSFNLDNRTTKILASNVPAGSKHAAFDQFKFFGELVVFDYDETSGIIHLQYKQRKDAEKAMQTKISVKGNFLKLAWVDFAQAQSSGTITTTSNQGAAVEKDSPVEPLVADIDALYEDEDESERGWKHNR